MAKKKKLQSQAPVMTRGQLSRAAREKRRVRNLYTAAIAVGTIIVLVLGYALINTYIIRPNAEVAKVGDVTITRDTYNKLRRYNLYSSVRNSAFYQQQFGDTSVGGLGSVTELQAQLRNANNETVLDADTVNQLVDGEVLRQKSPDLGVNPSRAELVAAQMKDLVPQPTAPPTTPSPEPPVTPSSVVSDTATPTSSATVPTATPTTTPTAGSPTSTSTATATFVPVPGGQQTAEALYPRFVKALGMGTSPSNSETQCALGCPNISEDDYLRLVMEPRVRREQATEKLAATQVLTEVAQIRAQRIMTDTKAAAETIQARLAKNEDFGKVANETSKEEIDRINGGQPGQGGDIGWLTKEGNTVVTDAEFAAKALELKEQPGQVSEPFQIGNNWYLVKILERAEKRPREQIQIDNLKQKAYDDWFNGVKASYGDRITTKLPSLPSVPTQPAIPEPTVAVPIDLTPQGPQGPPTPGGQPTGTVGTGTTTPSNPAATATIATTPAQPVQTASPVTAATSPPAP
jgi:hypothetical protein